MLRKAATVEGTYIHAAWHKKSRYSMCGKKIAKVSDELFGEKGACKLCARIIAAERKPGHPKQGELFPEGS